MGDGEVHKKLKAFYPALASVRKSTARIVLF